MQCPNCGESNSDEARFCQACGTKLEAPEPEAAQPVEARKTVSLVFCDLTGSTALGDKMDPEALRRVITRYFNEMKQVLMRHGGTVEKFIGDAVMAAFGVPTVHEDDALRAVRAAVEMQQTMEEMNLDLELEWGVGLLARIGVNTGEVIAGDASAGHGFVSGDAVNVAARLEQAAPSGEILIGVDTYKLVRDAVEVEEVEPLELKGKPEPVPAYKVTGVIPHALGVSRNLEAPLIGRKRELDLITEAFDKAHTQGSCELVTLFGAAGAGKSRVTAEFVSKIQGDVTMLQGRCLPYGEGITYFPVAEVIKNVAGIDDSDTATGAVEKIAAHLPEGEEAGLVCQRLAALMGLSEETPDTQEIFWAVRKFLEALARNTTLIVVLDDMHWAEQTLLDLVEYLAGFSQGIPMMILCLARKDLLDTRPTWGQGSTSIVLEPLSADEVGQLIANLVGGGEGFPDSVKRRIVEAAEGNPLYVEEIMKMLIDDRVLVKDDGRWSMSGEFSEATIPPTIHALVAARLDRLGPHEQAVTQRASVIGKTFWWGAVSHLSPEQQRPRVGHHLQTLSRKELVLPDVSTFAGEDAFRFAHIMIRDTAYQGMSKEQRGELHQRFAEWLIERAGEREREYEEILGYHFEQAYRLREELGHSDETTENLAKEATDRLASAGSRAFARSDMHAAANLLGRAAQLLPIRDSKRAQLTLMWVEALIELGELDQARDLVEQLKKIAKATKDERIGARADLDSSLLRSYTEVEGWREAARTDIERLVPILEKHSDHIGLARAHVLLGLTFWEEYRLGDAEKAYKTALEHAQAADEKAHDEGKILSSLAVILCWGPTPVEEAIEIATTAIEESGGNRVVSAGSRVSVAALHAMNGSFDEARESLATGRTEMEELGQILQIAGSGQEAAIIELLAGDPVAAEAELRRSVSALEAIGEKAFLSTCAAMLARALNEQGRYDDAEEASRVSEEAASDDPSMKAEWGPARAISLASRQKYDEAEELAKQALELAAEPDDILIRGYALEALAHVLREAGKGDEAAPILAEALQLYEKKGITPFIERLKALQN